MKLYSCGAEFFFVLLELSNIFVDTKLMKRKQINYLDRNENSSKSNRKNDLKNGKKITSSFGKFIHTIEINIKRICVSSNFLQIENRKYSAFQFTQYLFQLRPIYNFVHCSMFCSIFSSDFFSHFPINGIFLAISMYNFKLVSITSPSNIYQIWYS